MIELYNKLSFAICNKSQKGADYWDNIKFEKEMEQRLPSLGRSIFFLAVQFIPLILEMIFFMPLGLFIQPHSFIDIN